MSILSDAEIRERCVCPETKTVHPQDPNKTQGNVTTLLAWDSTPVEVPLTEEEKAAFRPMISPFLPTLVREILHTHYKPMSDGNGGTHMTKVPAGMRKIISAGLSSYGYDVQLADEIKLFTNINSSIIDPKRLDERCLVDADIKTDIDGARYVVMPPNSYILGRTIEYFDIPRDVMVIALGKSTYARAGAIVNVTPIEPGFQGHVVIEVSNSTNLPLKLYVEEGCAQFLFFQGDRACEISYADRGGKYQSQTGVTLPKV